MKKHDKCFIITLTISTIVIALCFALLDFNIAPVGISFDFSMFWGKIVGSLIGGLICAAIAYVVLQYQIIWIKTNTEK